MFISLSTRDLKIEDEISLLKASVWESITYVIKISNITFNLTTTKSLILQHQLVPTSI